MREEIEIIGNKYYSDFDVNVAEKNIKGIEMILNEIAISKMFGGSVNFETNNDIEGKINEITKRDIKTIININNPSNTFYKLVTAKNGIVKYGGGKMINLMQILLTLIGFAPVVGEPADLLSGIVSIIFERDIFGGILSFASLIPVIGIIPGIAKLIRLIRRL